MPAPKGNKNALGNNGGKPPKYTSQEDMAVLIDEYFNNESKKEKPKPTISGLAYWLGFESRQSIYDYEDKVEFAYIIKRAISGIEIFHEEGLYNQSNAGHIFWLKNRGWKDTQHLEHGGLNLTIKSKSKKEKDILDDID